MKVTVPAASCCTVVGDIAPSTKMLVTPWAKPHHWTPSFFLLKVLGVQLHVPVCTIHPSDSLSRSSESVFLLPVSSQDFPIQVASLSEPAPQCCFDCQMLFSYPWHYKTQELPMPPAIMSLNPEMRIVAGTTGTPEEPPWWNWGTWEACYRSIVASTSLWFD